MNIGVFDSGIGGEAVANSLRNYFPEAEITVVNDRENLPYGDKTSHQIRLLTDAAIQPLLGSDAIVIACNSATTAAIEFLRGKYTNQKFIGIEPMIKPALNLTKTRIIGVCATPATLGSNSYRMLKDKYARNYQVVEPDCSNWAQMIENNDLNNSEVITVLDEMIANQVDVIVLGCTHYHWIKELIVEYVGPDIQVLEPSEAIGRRVSSLLGD